MTQSFNSDELTSDNEENSNSEKNSDSSKSSDETRSSKSGGSTPVYSSSASLYSSSVEKDDANLQETYNDLKEKLAKIANNLQRYPAEREKIEDIKADFYKQYDYTFYGQIQNPNKSMSQLLGKNIEKIIEHTEDYNAPGPVVRFFLPKEKLEKTRKERLAESTDFLQRTYTAVTDLSLENINQLKKLTEKKENIRKGSLIFSLMGLLSCAVIFVASALYAYLPATIASCVGMAVLAPICLGLWDYRSLARTGDNIANNLKEAEYRQRPSM